MPQPPNKGICEMLQDHGSLREINVTSLYNIVNAKNEGNDLCFFYEILETGETGI